MWKSKYKNAFLFFQFLIVFSIFFGVFSYGISKFRNLKEDLGFNLGNVYAVNLGFESDLDSASLITLNYQIITTLKSIKDVKQVGFTQKYPFDGFTSGYDKEAYFGNVSKDFFDILGMKFVKGRNFEDIDRLSKGVIVNKLFYDKYIKEGGSSDKELIKKLIDNPNRIVGVVEHFKPDGYFSEEQPFVFELMNNIQNNQLLLIKLHKGSKPIIENEISDLLKKVIKTEYVHFENLSNLEKLDFKNGILPLSGMLFLAIFLIINVAMGLFGVLRYNISKRKSEIGLRKALGATNFDVKKQFVGEMLVLVSFALLIALFFAVQIPFITTMPFSTENYILGIGTSIVLVYSVVLICSYFPSKEAANMLPANALHEN